MRHSVAGTLNTCGRVPPEKKKIKIINLELDSIG
jgi:hypothetical protein